MEINMLCLKNVKLLWLVVLLALFIPSNAYTDQFAWVDYKRDFSSVIKVCSSKQATINVDIPPEVFKMKREYFIIVIQLNILASDSYANNWLFINNHRYKIKTNHQLGSQVIEIKIKSKHLEIGKNVIRATTSWKQNWGSAFCGYVLNRLFFKDLVTSTTNIATAPDLSKEDGELSPFLDKHILPVSKNSETNSDAIAVIIGNQKYENKDIPTVDFAINDTTAVKKYLINTLGYKDGNIIYNINSSKADLEMIFGTERNHKGMLHNYIKPKKSEVFIYYSGHGSPDPNTNKAYLVPTDCNPVMMDLTAYPLDILYGNLPKLEAKSITVVIDACFSGGTNTGKWLVLNASPALLKVKNPVTTQNNLTILTSAENNQVSSWYPEMKHSLFTYFFLKAVVGNADLNQDKKITYQEIFDFVTDRAEGVPYYAKRLHGGRMQTPTMHAANKDAVFVAY